MEHLDHEHDRGPELMTDHGHHCAPILVDGKVSGVLNLYVEPGHRTSPDGLWFRQSVTDVLATVVRARRIA